MDETNTVELSIDGETYRLQRGTAVPDDFDYVPPGLAIRLVEGWARWGDRRKLARLAEAVQPGQAAVSRTEADRVARLLVDELGALVDPLLLLRRRPQEVALDLNFVPDVVDLADLAEEPPLEEDADIDHFIEIRLVDEADQPVTGERYCVELPDGKRVEGTTDAFGIIRIDSIFKPGECRVEFPDLQAELQREAS